MMKKLGNGVDKPLPTWYNKAIKRKEVLGMITWLTIYTLWKWSLKIAEMWILVGWWAGLTYLLAPLVTGLWVGIPAAIRKYREEKERQEREFWERICGRPSQTE
jgi:hypothetical protein